MISFYPKVPPLLALDTDLLCVTLLANHWVKMSDKDQRSFLTNFENHIFLDNWILDGSMLEQDDYFSVIQEVKPALFTLPAIPNDTKASFDLFTYYYDRLPDELKISAAPILYSEDLSEKFLDWLNKEQVQTVALPFGFFDRQKIIAKLEKLRHKEIIENIHVHLLGIQDLTSLFYFRDYHGPLSFSSISSSMLYSTSKAGYFLDKGQISKDSLTQQDINDEEINKELLIINSYFLLKNGIFC